MYAAAVARGSKAMAAAGMAAGERAAFLSKGTLDFWVALLSAQALGVAPVLLNWRQSTENLLGMVDDAKATSLLVGAPYRELGGDVAAALPGIVRVLALDGPAAAIGWGAGGDGESGAPSLNALRAAPLGRGSEAAVYFTSGSTSRPKPVLHTHGTLLWTAAHFVLPEGATSTLSFLPNFHVIMSFQSFILPLARGVGCLFAHRATLLPRSYPVKNQPRSGVLGSGAHELNPEFSPPPP